VEPLLLIGGVSYDWVRFPVNHRFGPVSDVENHRDQVSPKAGFVWTPLANTTVRGAYARVLGGVSFDQSFQLEPSQVAGFNQAFRSIIPESAAGPTTAPRFETWDVSLEQKFGRGTYAGLTGEWLQSDATRVIGVYEFLPPIATASTRELLDYRERSLVFSMYQLLADEWSAGLRYRVSQAELERRFPDIPSEANFVGDFRPRQNLESLLHQLNLFTIYTHPSGFFAQLNALWMAQSNRGYSPDRPGDDFWQFNLFAGYRFPRRRAELRVGLLNLTDQDYRINPLNLTAYLPRDRTLTLSLKFNF
jgi:outer membrane receptor protein involved in Fe transport